MAKIKVDTNEFIYALEDHSPGAEYFLDTKTGEIVFLSEFHMPEESDLRERLDKEEGRYIHRAF